MWYNLNTSILWGVPSMEKLNTSLRIDKGVLTRLDDLVKHYQEELDRTSTFSTKVSRATVIEILVNEKHRELNGKG